MKPHFGEKREKKGKLKKIILGIVIVSVLFFILGSLLEDDEIGRYVYSSEGFKILGALKSAEDDAEAFEFEMDTFKVTKDTKFAETELGDGHFCLLFEMIDADKNDYTSEAVLFTVEDGNMSYDE